MLSVGLWYAPPVTVPVWANASGREGGTMVCRGVRGATTVQNNQRDVILRETRRLLALLIKLNGIAAEDVASVIFTTTPDLNAEFPALAARQLGWREAALLCGHEMNVPGSLPRCIRILVHWNTEKSAADIRHVYLNDAQTLRPDLQPESDVDWDALNAWIDAQMTRGMT